ncbi:Protein chibby-like protein 2 [Frankliniella fusca]|uniref:Protein chibby-like protein 2 n=1 Tax=Frankliniella fusca TaxID=407009 RepID=A0AAE1LFN4_9NEOP|nr:Protein chibby-like protein 2 [Frankliniella fusca]
MYGVAVHATLRHRSSCTERKLRRHRTTEKTMFSSLQSKNTAPPYPVLHIVFSTVVPYIAICHRYVTLKVRHCRLFL